MPTPRSFLVCNTADIPTAKSENTSPLFLFSNFLLPSDLSLVRAFISFTKELINPSASIAVVEKDLIVSGSRSLNF